LSRPFTQSFIILQHPEDLIMALVATASKPATFAEVLAGKRKPSDEQKECYLLKRLP
jgi:hypothetical protein